MRRRLSMGDTCVGRQRQGKLLCPPTWPHPTQALAARLPVYVLLDVAGALPDVEAFQQCCGDKERLLLGPAQLLPSTLTGGSVPIALSMLGVD